MNHFRDLALSAIALLISCSTAGAVEAFPADCKLTLAATVPIGLEGGHFTVPVTVNGHARTFIIDTGGLTSAISPSIVAEQGIKTYGIHAGTDIQDIAHKKAELYVTLDELVIGNQKARNARMMVLDDIGVEGLIGPEYLRNFDLEFDFAAGTLNLFRPHPCKDRAVYWTDDYFTLPMDVTDQGHIRIDVSLDGKPLRAMIDTDAPVTVIGQAIARSDFDVDPSQVNVDGATAGKIIGGNGGEMGAVPHRFTGLRLGGINIKNPILAIATVERGFHADHSSLLLGMRELHNLHLYVAYQERKLYFSRANAGAADPARVPH